MAEINENTNGGYDASKGLEISPAQAIEDDVYEEKVKGADAVFAYPNVEVIPLYEVINARLLRKIDFHVFFGYVAYTCCNTWIRERMLLPPLNH